MGVRRIIDRFVSVDQDYPDDQDGGLEDVFDLLGILGVGGKSVIARSETTRAVSIVEATRVTLNSGFRDEVRLDELADAVSCSKFHLSRMFKQHTGHGIIEYLTMLRLRESLELLRDPSRSVTSIAYDLGFSSHSHFTSTFRRQFGTTPSVARLSSPKESIAANSALLSA